MNGQSVRDHIERVIALLDGPAMRRAAAVAALPAAVGLYTSCTYASEGFEQSGVDVTPDSARVLVSESQDFEATALYDDGTSGDVSCGAVWTTSSDSVATVDACGVATGRGEGDAVITATFGGFEDSATLTVAR